MDLQWLYPKFPSIPVTYILFKCIFFAPGALEYSLRPCTHMDSSVALPKTPTRTTTSRETHLLLRPSAAPFLYFGRVFSVEGLNKRNFTTKTLYIMDAEADSRDSSLILIKQGAEARVFESSFVGRRSVVKERFSKKYRHPTLDSKLTLKRLNAEARCMTKARRLGVRTPALYAVDPVLHTLTFEYVEGPSVKDVFLEFGSHGVNEERLGKIASQIGVAIGKLHDGGLVHGDLTTSNMLLRNDTDQLVLIDFGLSFTSTLPEDKAVDLYVLERALLSMHSSCGNVMDQILAAYRKSSKQWSSTLNKLAQVRQRGRKRTMVG